MAKQINGINKNVLLDAMNVSDVWKLVVKKPSTIGPDATIEELLHKMVEDTRTRHVYVVDDKRNLVGVVRMNMVTGILFPIQALSAELSEPCLFRHTNIGGNTVREVMNKKPCTVRPDTRLQDMARILMEEKITELPVVNEENELIGQVNMYEIINAYLQI